MKACFRLAMVVVFFSILTQGQTFRGGITGVVTDSSGAAIPQASVKVVSEDTGLERTVTTDSEGNYTVTELPLGSYKVTTSKQGFSTRSLSGVHVAVSANQRVDVKLVPGEVQEKIEVSAEVPIVDTTSNTLGGIIDQQTAAELPVNGRDFTKLLTLVPGSNADPSSVNDAPGSFGIFSINGNRGRSNNYLLDGTDMNDGYRNDPAINEAGVFGTPATLLPIDAVSEMGVISNVEAEYGRNSGAVVNIVTKSGTNTLHGSGFEYFRNSALDARNYFNAKPNPQNQFHNNQFGASVGGPVIKDRTFFFGAWEGWREYGALPAVASIPTQARVNNYIATTGPVNAAISNLLQRNPWGVALPATGDDASDPLSNKTVQVSDKFSNRVDSVILKLDHHLGGSDRHDLLTGRYFFGDSDQSFPFALGGGTTIADYNTVTPTRVQVLSLSYTHIWTPKLVMEVRGGWNRFAEGFFPQDSDFNPASIGLNNNVGPQDFGLPLIQLRDGTSGLGANNSIPRHRFDTNAQYFTNMSYNVGKHNWKFGYEYRRTSINQYYDLGYRSRLRFSDFEHFLGGVIDRGGLQFAGNSQRNTHQNNHAFYAQDSFRFTRKITVNYGVRWDYYGVISEGNNQLSIFNTSTQSLQQVGTSGLDSLYPKDKNNFSPRIAVAWDLRGNGSTVVRAGWGLFYDAFSQDFFIGHFPFNTFNPGMTYNSVGPNPISGGSFSTTDVDGNGVIVPGQPIFSGFTPTADAWTVDQNIKTPYIQNYNVNIERQLGNRAALQVAYVGSTGKKLFRFRDINQLDPATGNAPFAGFGYINQFESSAWSNYNGLQLTAKMRNWRGLTMDVNYNWSHSIDNASDGEDYVPNASQPDNSLNPRGEKGNSNFDRRQSFTWNFNYQFPNHGGKLLSGWSIDGLLRLSTGQPYNLNSFESYNGTGEFFERPDVVGNPFAGTSTPAAILNLSAFAAPCDWDPVNQVCFGGYHFGNLPRNAFMGPSFRNFDFSLVKNTKLTERIDMQLRADFFNIFNHPNFSNPLLPNFLVDLETNGLVASNPGDPACAAAPYTGCRAFGQGLLPITATPDVGIGNPFLGGGGPRNIQLAVRFSF